MSGQCWFTDCRYIYIYSLLAKRNALRALANQPLGIHPMLFQCWASVEDGGPTTLKQQLFWLVEMARPIIIICQHVHRMM